MVWVGIEGWYNTVILGLRGCLFCLWGVCCLIVLGLFLAIVGLLFRIVVFGLAGRLGVWFRFCKYLLFGLLLDCTGVVDIVFGLF